MMRTDTIKPWARDEIDVRAGRYVSGVYLYMMLGVMVTALVAYALLGSGLMLSLAVNGGQGFALGIFVLQLGTVLAFRPVAERAGPGAVFGMFFFYSAITGVTVGYAGLIYRLPSIFNCFFAAALAFGGLAGFGHITRRNLGLVGTFCLQALMMMVIFSLVFMVASFFPALRSFLPAMDMSMGIVGLLVFSGLTAYESQRLRETAFNLARSDASEAVITRWTGYGALTMYLNFINLFFSLLRLFGDRRR